MPKTSRAAAIVAIGPRQIGKPNLTYINLVRGRLTFDRLTQKSPHAISPQLFHSKLKHCSLVNPILIHRHPHTYLPVSTPNTIHHSRLTVCLPDSLGLDRCLSILFWLSACE